MRIGVITRIREILLNIVIIVYEVPFRDNVGILENFMAFPKSCIQHTDQNTSAAESKLVKWQNIYLIEL
ncbi:hypothetical protein ES703_122878 [subsurface metagenome]